jgi:hypothetical protein
MAFTPVIVSHHVFGDKRIVIGTFASDGGSTGGDIVTPLHHCEGLILTPKTSAPALECAVNETFPVAGAAVTIVTSANVEGYFMAIGDGV